MAAPQLTAVVPGLGVVSADTFNTYEQTCDSVAQLRLFVGKPGIQVFTRGLAAANDGGAGPFMWNATSTSADNGTTVIAPTGLNIGRWIRLTLYAGSGGGTTSQIILQNLTGQPASLTYATTTGATYNLRWQANKNTDAESGANTGSNYEIDSYADNGTLLGYALKINRATRVSDFYTLPTVFGGAFVNALPVFGPSGPSHAPGLVPDPGNVTGSSNFLREDGTWASPSQSGSGVPTGAVVDFLFNSPQTGYIYCNGAAVSRVGANAALFALIGTNFGIGDGSTTFNVPDFRGYFFRAAADGQTIDTGRTTTTSTATVTITIASPGVVTWTAHGFAVNQPVWFTTSGTLPTGIVSGTIYYIKTVTSANAFTLCATPGGTVIATGGSQSGTQTGNAGPKIEADAVGPHTHTLPGSNANLSGVGVVVANSTGGAGNVSSNTQVPTGTTETRPLNYAVYKFIKL